MANSKSFNFYPVILAGGRGTRFWPLSRKRLAKQLLPLNSKKSMIQETVERLLPLAKAKHFWVITNDDLRVPIVRQLKKLNKKQIIAEPVGRNTAPAIGLAAFLLERRDPSAVIGMFPSDHVIGDEKRFRDDIRRRPRSPQQARTSSSSASSRRAPKPAMATSKQAGLAASREPRATADR